MTNSRLASIWECSSVGLLFALNGCGARVAIEDSSSTGGATGDTSTSWTTGTSASSAYTTGTNAGSGFTTGTTVYTGYTTSTEASTGVKTRSSTGVSTGVYTGYTTSTAVTAVGTGVDTTSVVQTYTSTSVVTSTGCGGIPLVVTPGQLSVVDDYVTIGALKGYGYTWVYTSSPNGSCITPACDTGCSPAFAPTSLCAAGVVAADPTYLSVVGVGFNLHQSQTGTVEFIAAPTSIIVNASMAIGAESYTRLQLTGASNSFYCVDAGKWASGVPIPITNFNSACWDNSGIPLYPGVPISGIDLAVPCDAFAARPYSVCLTNVVFD